MNNENFLAMPEDLRKVVVDGFSALQQATFASPKRKSIQAYADFTAAGGTIYVPTPEQKAQFQTAAEPVYTWFKGNVKDGQKWYDLLKQETAKTQLSLKSDYQADLN